MNSYGKTRIQMPGRSAGDGMENSHIPAFDKKKWTVIQERQDALSSLHTKNFAPTASSKVKAKFVPYEPYKAAVSPIHAAINSNDSTSKFVIDSQKVSSLASSIIELYSSLEDKKSFNGISDKICNNECCDKIKSLEERIKDLEKENKELISQHQVQIEVNADLKKMLVASLGEDVQCKVQYMTEDKAHLGKEVLQLSEEVEQIKEENEKLSVQCNIWESKFKASSLMVKELAQWKASLSHKLNESIATLDCVLKEHDVLYEQLYTAHSILEQTLDAFDPGAKQVPKKPQDLSPSILKLSMQVKSLSTKIQERLLGKTSCNLEGLSNEMRQLTRAENLINELFENFEKTSSVKDLNPTKEAGRVACHILPHVCVNESNVNYCKHCSGKIEIV